MQTDMAYNLMGGLGMILLGMKLMTDGLKVAGGGMLRKVLRASTKTPVRGLLSGFAITSLVQSSSAVTVAAIGFVNAGLMTLAGVVWVVYGSNVGTTTTAWIVAAIGLKIKIKALALPFVAVGTAIWLSARMPRRSALGEALAGFGIFFYGIEFLRIAFDGLEHGLPMALILQSGILGHVVYVGIGFFLTLVMQSSSAAMALILTATAGGVASIEMSAAAVIGANLGTTTTAALASIGATPNAKRVAAVHVIFNVVTGIAAFALLLPILHGIDLLRTHFTMSPDPAQVLALFHTIFNVLGVLLLACVTRPLLRFVEKRFRTAEEDEARPAHLDDNVLQTPALGVNAMLMELGRIFKVAGRMASKALTGRKNGSMDRDREILGSLQRSLGDFAARMSGKGLSSETARTLPLIMRVSQYYNAAATMVREAEYIRQGLESIPDEDFSQKIMNLMGIARAIVDNANAEKSSFSHSRLELLLDDFQRQYQELKESILTGLISGSMDVETMIGYLERISHIRRMAEQLTKGAHLHYNLIRERMLHKLPEDEA